MHLWRNVHEHHGLGLVGQGVLQQLRELGVAVGHMLVMGRQGRHHIPKCRQAAVDVLGLLQPIPRRLAAANSLTACSVVPKA